MSDCAELDVTHTTYTPISFNLLNIISWPNNGFLSRVAYQVDGKLAKPDGR